QRLAPRSHPWAGAVRRPGAGPRRRRRPRTAVVPDPRRFATGPSDPVTRPRQRQIAGVGWTAALEHPQRWGGTIDLPAALDDRTARPLAAALSGALGAEDQLAVRPTGTWARRIVRAGRPSGRPAWTWTPRGTTLITGGSGTLAPQLTRWLAARGAEHVVLVSRRGAHAPAPPNSRRNWRSRAPK
ncbi:KR domain-containing protein, partial [Streptomyces albulus]|nr:KR domain-containing protein [Streptomyces noursei]